MLDEVLEKLQKRLLETEIEIIDSISDLSLKELVDFYNQLNQKTLDVEYIEEALQLNRKFGQEAFFSTFRLLKAILAEIEYRIKENKI